MKQRVTFIGMICVSVALCANAVIADCGKILIYPYQWSMTPQGGPQVYDMGNTNPINIYNSLNGGNSTTDVNVGQLQENYNALLDRVTNLTELITKLEQRLDATNSRVVASNSQAVDQKAKDNPGTAKKPKESVTGKDGSFKKATSSGKKGIATLGYFNEPEQQAVISWNGYCDENGRETLILTTNEEISTPGATSYLLSVLPLPGPPESVEPANPESFVVAKSLFLSKTPTPMNSITEAGVVLTAKIGAHNIFVWELEDVETFQSDVQAWVANEFGGQAAAYITDETMSVLQYYIDRGFMYFAFDLTEVGEISTKAAIAYTFTSPFVYYPLVISQIGGTADFTKVDLIIITPGSLKPGRNSAIQKFFPPEEPAPGKDEATLERGGTVEFTIDEVRGIDEHLDVFDDDDTELTVRNITFNDELNSFTKDFVLKSPDDPEFEDDEE